ncbi:hypothetical protein B0H15DRAFT_474013 [Mycena belliarum]|uniref:DUF6534 domain-containing protein n=1 Tax=Mycena belliarum TaxID=1033014 RepID=A0AAD6XMS8_9AGAR|nr:hypothetical protein B0H15DRAFT_474013 [Mycena belliae]
MDYNVSAAVPPSLRIVDFSGPLIIAVLLHWGLFGTLSVQIYLYYQAFPNDRPSTKCLVYIVYVIELAQTILMTHDIFLVFGAGFGNLVALTKIYFDWLTVPVMSGVVALIGQSFYAYRVYVLSESWIIPLLIVVISLTSTAGAFVTGALSFQAGNIIRLNSRNTSVAVGVWCGASALSDVMIAICMTYYLTKRDTGYRQTRVLISKLIRLTIETGSLTAVVVLTGLALFFAFPSRTYYTAAAAIIPKLYANSMLAVLNARLQILGGRGTSVSSIDMISTPTYLHAAGPGVNASEARHGSTVSHVTITREVLSDRSLNEDIELKGMRTHLPMRNADIDSGV